MAIPKILHLIWLGDKTCPDYSNIVNFFEQQKWDIKLWGEQHINPIYFSEEEINLINRFPKTIQRADALRLIVVKKYGGVYMDMDFDIVKPIDELLNCPAFVGREDEDKLCNAIFGAERNSDFLECQIGKLSAMPNDHRVWGIKLMTDIAVGCADFPVVIYPQEYFYPYPWHEENPENKKPKENTYLMHRWEQSWWEGKNK